MLRKKHGRRRSEGAGGLLASFVPKALAIFLVASTGACAAPAEADEDFQIEWSISPNPPRVGPATFTLTPADTSGAPIQGADLRLEGNMSHPGMQPVFAEAAEGPAGIYTVPFEFTMAGDWIILVEATLPDGRSVRDQFDVRGVQAR